MNSNPVSIDTPSDDARLLGNSHGEVKDLDAGSSMWVTVAQEALFSIKVVVLVNMQGSMIMGFLIE
uniref:Uncharacterized protein n=1 Tax=Salix viminalis TaxID=40686 RepID=A0A6N2LQY5_SALVM